MDIPKDTNSPQPGWLAGLYNLIQIHLLILGLMETKIKTVIQSSIDLKTKVLGDQELIDMVQQIVHEIVRCYEKIGRAHV